MIPRTKSKTETQLVIKDTHEIIFQCKIIKKKMIGKTSRYLSLYPDSIVINK